MGENSKISWTDNTFNPWIGCAKVSPGCANCYAEGFASRFGMVKWGVGQPRQRTSPANWRKPLAWDRKAAAEGKRVRVFCASLADWLDPEVPVEWLADLLDLIARTPHLDWLLLTKRPEAWRDRIMAAQAHLARTRMVELVRGQLLAWLSGHAPANVWVGTTVEDQRRADERIPKLLSIPARVRFLSMEPLLDAVDLQPILGNVWESREVKNGWHGLDWVIVGGESGHKARPFNLAWARNIVRQCKDAGVPVFVKQMGDNASDEINGLASPRVMVPQEALPLVSRRFTAHHGADPAEWPADLRVQEVPTC